jgi:6-phosphogluconolactonase
MTSQEHTLYVGSGASQIYRLALDLTSGSLTLKSTTDVGDLSANSRPTYISIHPNKKHLYTISAIAKFNEEENTGGILAYTIDQATHNLLLLNSTISSGNGPCSILVDHSGKNLLVANYHGGTFGVWKIENDGSVHNAPNFLQKNEGEGGPIRSRQDKPHPHQFIMDRSNKFAFCCDLGLDKVFQFVYDANAGSVVPNEPAVVDTKPGAGPRHIDFHPTKDVAYVITELGNTVDTYAFDKVKGTLSFQSSITTIPEGDSAEGNTASEIILSEDGKFIYASNRGHDSIITYKIGENGDLTWVGHVSCGGKGPRHFTLFKDFALVANQNSGDVKVFRRNAESGELTQVSSIDGLKEPMCVVPL